MLIAEYQDLICKFGARRFELLSMLKISILGINSFDYRAFITPKTDKNYNFEF